jgi:plastocyanin
MAAVVVVALGVAAGCGGSDSDSSADGDSAALSGSVGPGFDISMNQEETPAGTYTLTVDDQASDHNFRLTGPGGVDVATDVAETGTKTFDVTLEAGTYTFVCDPHASTMTGTLTVT